MTTWLIPPLPVDWNIPLMPFLPTDLRPTPQVDALSEGTRLALAVGALEAVQAAIVHPYKVRAAPLKHKRLSQRDLIEAIHQIVEQALWRVK